MQVIIRPRRSGKTTLAVEWVKQGEATNSYPFWSRVLLVPTVEAAMNVRKNFPELDYTQVFSWGEYRNARLGVKPVEVMVDNADILIAQTLGLLPERVTITGEVSTGNPDDAALGALFRRVLTHDEMYVDHDSNDLILDGHLYNISDEEVALVKRTIGGGE